MSETIAVELEKLRGEVNTGLATLSGKIDALTAVKTGDHSLIARQIAEVAESVEHTDKVAQEGRALARVAQKRLDRMTWVGLGVGVGSSVGGGGVVFALAKIFGL